MLQRPGPGHGVLAGRLPHQQRRQVVALGPLRDHLGHLVHLRDPTGPGVDRRSGDGLHRVHDQQGGSHVRHVGQQLLQFGLVGDEQIGNAAPRSAGPAVRSARRTPPRRRTAPVPLCSAKRCPTSSSSVDLPTPGSPATSTTCPGTSPPPSTRSNSPTPGTAPFMGVGPQIDHGARGATRCCGRALGLGPRLGPLGGRDFGEGAELGARRALAQPLGRAAPTLAALVLGPGRHGHQPRRGVRQGPACRAGAVDSGGYAGSAGCRAMSGTAAPVLSRARARLRPARRTPRRPSSRPGRRAR